ncbi:ABC transporter permease [Ruminococcus albus]|uniref:Putative ABC transport system permease protein n=1 Tax=Ruminococcus albus TaxID=1264 RepID=A0A1I1JFV3_RUMAL|nr:ABC transporter permease [Ruminococcus albus]SFC44843.1 putative ABC transport system permease protein [Ruminococcus albus]
MLFKLSVSNIRRSLRDYAIYFFTLMIGVSVFYVFNAIGGQAAMMRINDSSYEVIDILRTVLSGISVFVAGVLGLLIVYASRFLMKRRKREFALYMTLGMSKGSISRLLLIETVIIGLGSLAAGLLVGIGLSQLMSALVANLFEADMTAYKFTVSTEAIVKTILYFAVMYLVVMVFNSIVITKMKLIDLMQSGRRSEQIKLKNPIVCVLIFIAAVIALSIAYYNVTVGYNDLNEDKFIGSVITGIISTFFIFWSVSGMLLRTVMSVKGMYYRSLNSFTFRQISSKVNTMVMSMTVICLMLFVTICMLAAAFTIRNSMNSNIKELCPADFEGRVYIYNEEHTSDLEKMYKEAGEDITEDFSEYKHFYSYFDEGFTFEDFLGDKAEEIKAQYPNMMFDSTEELVRVSDYNALMKIYGRKELKLEDDSFIVLCNYGSVKALRDTAIEKGNEINVFGKTLRSQYSSCVDGFISISSNKANFGIIIVPDDVVDESGVHMEYFIGNYLSEDKEAAEKTVAAKFDNVMDLSDTADNYYIRDSRIQIKADSVGIGAIATFVGLYIGLVFLIASGAVLALKELSESVDSVGRYEMLRKIGADEKDLGKSLLRQTGIFFLIPLLLACVHSVFGMRFAARTLEVFGTENIGQSMTVTTLIILMIYGGYFLITFFSSKSIVKERR